MAKSSDPNTGWEERWPWEQTIFLHDFEADWWRVMDYLSSRAVIGLLWPIFDL